MNPILHPHTSLIPHGAPLAFQEIIPGSGSIPEFIPERSATPVNDHEPSSNATPVTVLRSRKACYACRTRKVKCDGQDICGGCLARSIECVYDAKPKRRGPDKVPGARRRRSGAPKDLSDLLPPQAIDPETQTTIYDSKAWTRPAKATLAQRQSRQTRTAGGPTNKDVYHRHNTQNEHPNIARTPSPVSDASRICAGLDDAPNSSEFSQTRPNTFKEPPPQAPGVRNTDVLIPHEERVVNAVAVANGVFAWSNDVMVWDIGPSITHGPSVQFYRKTWWDALLGIYSSDRFTAVRTITSDLTLLFRKSSHIISFIRVPHFINNMLYPLGREQMQPSLALSMLALSSLMQSIGSRGAIPRERAVLLQRAAQAALEASINAGWFDFNIAQAAMVLALYEATAQPFEIDGLIRPAFHMLDAILSSMSLLTLDAANPAASAAFVPETGPIVNLTPLPNNHSERQWASTLAIPQLPTISCPYPTLPPGSSSDSPEPPCDCSRLSLSSDFPVGSSTLGRDWLASPGHHSYWTEAMIAREQSRILVWSAFALLSAYSVHRISSSTPRLRLRLINPSNFALLFPGEALHISRGFAPAGKESNWALYIRSFLLLHSCVDMKESNLLVDDYDRTSFAMRASLEIDRIEKALNRHVCQVDLHRGWVCRQGLHLVRMAITYYDSSTYVPSVHVRYMPQRREAEEWAQYAQRSVRGSGFPDIIGLMAAQLPWNPYIIGYFVDVFVRCLQIWEVDNTSISALQVAMDISPALDYLVPLFTDSPFDIGAYRHHLLSRLQAACDVCNIPGPLSILGV